MEVSDQIIKVLDNLGQKFGVAVDWTQSNIVPYVQDLGGRIVKYEMITSIIYIIFYLIALVGTCFVFKLLIKRIKKPKENYYDDNFLEYLGGVGLGCIIFLIVGQVIGEIFDIVRCLTLPEQVWISYIQKYIQK